MSHRGVKADCINCSEENADLWITPDFGPLCDDCAGCLAELINEVAPIDWQARYQAREQQLKECLDELSRLRDLWAEDLKGAVNVPYERGMATAFAQAAGLLRTLISTEPKP